MSNDERPYLDDACKVVGVSSDFSLLARCEIELRVELGTLANVNRSQDYYLDVTPPSFNKGTYVRAMGDRLNIPREAIATVGDMANDVPMFGVSGLSFAMANAPDAVKAEATNVTGTNDADGFAEAVATIIALNARVAR
jgi:hydroxymethylpyrimidine pyrophosphatase-like HAD family hydrolase